MLLEEIAQELEPPYSSGKVKPSVSDLGNGPRGRRRNVMYSGKSEFSMSRALSEEGVRG